MQDSLSYARAYWVSRSIIAWNKDADDYSVYLYASEGAKLMVTETSVEGWYGDYLNCNFFY